MPERDDFVRAVEMLGVYDGEPVTIAVDASGRLYAVLAGTPEITIPGDVNVTQEDATRDIQGTDGETLRAVAVDSNGQIIMVPRGQSGNYLVVDSDGYLTTVIKGDYEGALRTVKLDDDGRLSAFVVDSVDAWGQMLSIGNAELAARLGSLKTYDRRGSVLDMQNFDSGLGSFELVKGGSGAYPVIAADRILSGGYSAYLYAPTGVTNASELRWYRGMAWAESFGVEIAFNLDALHGMLFFWCCLYDGAKSHPGVLRWNLDTGVLECLGGAGTYEEVATGLAVGVGKGKWNFLKLVIDTANDEYMRCLLGGTEIDMTSFEILDSADASPPYLYASVALYASASDAAEMWIDNLILTDREPA